MIFFKRAFKKVFFPAFSKLVWGCFDIYKLVLIKLQDEINNVYQLQIYKYDEINYFYKLKIYEYIETSISYKITCMYIIDKIKK